ncbi:MAG: serine/threonine protein kinase, partial [Clostridia bacterium]|nr:serine/threonine protein kinase [Clostridia bacterium]
SVSPGNYTTDKVFLLSIKEVKKYFFIDIYRKCQGTPHCYAKGAFKHLNACWWWLRSPGTSSARAADVGCEGTVVEGGDDVNRQIAVRPAMWINLGTEN